MYINLYMPAKDQSIMSLSIMVEIFVQLLVGALCLIVFCIQAVMDTPDRCAWQVGLQVKRETTVLQNQMHPSQQKDFSPLLSSTKLLCARGYTHIEIIPDSISETA
jgi:hypothetical protein